MVWNKAISFLFATHETKYNFECLYSSVKEDLTLF